MRKGDCLTLRIPYRLDRCRESKRLPDLPWCALTPALTRYSGHRSGCLERKSEKSSDAEEGKRHEIIPGELLFEEEDCKYDEDRDRDHLLNDLELKSRELDETEAIGGHRQTILEQCYY